eukprot:8754855-Pyramimonas_sp.AAC.6
MAVLARVLQALIITTLGMAGLPKSAPLTLKCCRECSRPQRLAHHLAQPSRLRAAAPPPEEAPREDRSVRTAGQRGQEEKEKGERGEGGGRGFRTSPIHRRVRRGESKLKTS